MTNAGNMSPVGGTIIGEGHIMNILLNDIQPNLPQKRYSDKETRVCIYYVVYFLSKNATSKVFYFLKRIRNLA